MGWGEAGREGGVKGRGVMCACAWNAVSARCHHCTVGGCVRAHCFVDLERALPLLVSDVTFPAYEDKASVSSPSPPSCIPSRLRLAQILVLIAEIAVLQLVRACSGTKSSLIRMNENEKI